MKRMGMCVKFLSVPILLGLLLGATGCCCMWPKNWGRGHHDDGGREHDRGGRYHDGGGHHHNGGRK